LHLNFTQHSKRNCETAQCKFLLEKPKIPRNEFSLKKQYLKLAKLLFYFTRLAARKVNLKWKCEAIEFKRFALLI